MVKKSVLEPFGGGFRLAEAHHRVHAPDRRARPFYFFEAVGGKGAAEMQETCFPQRCIFPK
jgi:hypothetical protein